MLAEQRGIGCWVLRADRHAQTITTRLVAAGISLPAPTQILEISDGRCAAGISDDESWWLLASDNHAEWGRMVRASLSGQHFSLVDTSQALRHFHLSGAGSTELLAHLIPYPWSSLDRPKVVASVMQTVPVTVIKKSTNGGFHLLIRRSFARYALEWINHIASAQKTVGNDHPPSLHSDSDFEETSC